MNYMRLGQRIRKERSLTLDTLARIVNQLGVTVDYMLSDSVFDNDLNIMEQFKQIIDGQYSEYQYLVKTFKEAIMNGQDK